MKAPVDIFVETPFGKIHALFSDGQKGLTPIVFIPGMLGKAEDWENDLESFLPRTGLAISLRGRGQSGYPAQGFSIFDHIHDIETVVNHLKLDKFILVGFSQGALYATAYAQKFPEKVASLIIQDKVLKQKKFGPEWLIKALGHPGYQDKKEFIKGLANESQEINLLKNCQPIADKPTLIMKGDLSILVTEEDLLEMKEIFKKSVVAIFPESGHDVSAPDYDLYIQTINNFIKRYPELT